MQPPKEKVKRNNPEPFDKAISDALTGINCNMNFVGFTKRFVSNLPNELTKGLTDKQREMAVLILSRYRRQIVNFKAIYNSLPDNLRRVADNYLRGLKTFKAI